MITRTLLFFCLVVLPTTVFAVVTRHDVLEEQHLLSTNPEYFVDLPYEGHGVLIDPEWVVTVAHTIFDDYRGMKLNIGEQHYEIKEVVIHPKYNKIPKELLQGHSAKIMDFLNENNDIALIKLASPVNKVKPLYIYNNKDETGKRFRFFGKGATGTGLTGDIKKTKKDKILRQGENLVVKSHKQWLIYKFDSVDSALPLEAMQGSGDSGAPVIIEVDNTEYLIGLMSWQYWLGNIKNFKPGLYEREAYAVRISSYIPWMKNIMQKHK